MKQKKISKAGSVTLPKEMRVLLGMPAGTPVDLSCGDYAIHISKHVPTCFCCGDTADVAEVCGLEVCRGCAKRIWDAFKEGKA